ncbi:MAG: hypothetical protein ACOVP7_07420 [Lacibacter sp.]
MRQILLLAFLFSTTQLFAQKYSGQWTGSFNSKNEPGSNTEYVLEIEARGNSFTGTSTTYFNYAGKRYYTICEIKGTIDPGSKTLTSTEVKVIKKNTPPDQIDCLQMHTLTYFRKGETEELSGTWKGARDMDKCGIGSTTLMRRQLVKNNVTAPPQNTTARTNPANNKPPVEKPVSKPVPKPATTEPKKETPVVTVPSITKVDNTTESQTKPEIKPATIPAPKLPNGLEKRESKVFETIPIEEEEITVNLFDNAEIDGDIITVLFNGEVVASQKTLSDKPITLKLKAIRGKDNTLTMYAENQGRVPPNTAIMRVQNGEQYYKVFLSADDKKNGSVVFRFKG